MAIVRVVTACPVSQDVVLVFGMPTHAYHQHTLRLRKHFTTHVAVLSVDVLAGTAPVLHLQVPRHFASVPEHCRTLPAVVTSLCMVSLVRQH